MHVNLQIPWVNGSFVTTEIFMLEGALKHVSNLVGGESTIIGNCGKRNGSHYTVMF